MEGGGGKEGGKLKSWKGVGASLKSMPKSSKLSSTSCQSGAETDDIVLALGASTTIGGELANSRMWARRDLSSVATWPSLGGM